MAGWGQGSWGSGEWGDESDSSASSVPTPGIGTVRRWSSGRPGGRIKSGVQLATTSFTGVIAFVPRGRTPSSVKG